MSIEIKITDPYGTQAAELRHLAAFFVSIADAREATDDVPTKKPRIAEKVSAPKPAPVATIDPDDHPDAGADPAQVFGQAGNVPSGAPSIAGAALPSIAPAAMLDSSATVPTAPQINAPSPVDAAATVAAPEAAQTPAPGVDLDADGLPWDGRIHASTRAKNADGRWRGKRGIDDATVASVSAELRAVMGNVVSGPAVDTPPIPAASPAPVAPPPPVAFDNVPPPPAPLGNVPPPPPVGVQVSLVAPPPAPAIASPAIAAVAPALNEFPALCARITQSIASGALTHARLGEVLGAHQLASLPTLAAYPHLVPAVATALGFA